MLWRHLPCASHAKSLFDRIWPGLEMWLSTIDGTTPDNIKRNKAYREAILLEREPVPVCTMEKIRNVFSDANGSYMGHKNT